jgi:hypothetical protein
MNPERLHVFIDADQRTRLERASASQGVSVATLVRDAIDLAYPSTVSLKAGAATAILEAAPMPVGSIDELRAERDRSHER